MIGYGKIDTATAGANTLVAGITGKKIQVIQYTLNAVADNTMTFKSATNALTGPMSLSASEVIVSVTAPSTYMTMNALFETNSGESLVLTLLNATQVSGHFTYRIVNDTE
jgi:hypothetical protein